MAIRTVIAKGGGSGAASWGPNYGSLPPIVVPTVSLDNKAGLLNTISVADVVSLVAAAISGGLSVSDALLLEALGVAMGGPAVHGATDITAALIAANLTVLESVGGAYSAVLTGPWSVSTALSLPSAAVGGSPPVHSALTANAVTSSISDFFFATTTWTAPTNTTTAAIVCRAAGGKGGNAAALAGGGGGGGGALSFNGFVPTTPSTVYTVTCGLATDCWFNTTGTILAKVGGNGGNGSGSTAGTAGAGGLASGGVGPTKFSGGNGAAGQGNGAGGGGGGGAGNGGGTPNGSNASGAVGGNGGSGSSVGGNGGNGGSGLNGNGVAGSAPGGGSGGGATASGTGPNGDPGYIDIIYTKGFTV